jgi:hypothetical protein
MTSVALLHRVEDVLHVHEDRDSIHGVTYLSSRQQQGVALILVDRLVFSVLLGFVVLLLLGLRFFFFNVIADDSFEGAE